MTTVEKAATLAQYLKLHHRESDRVMDKVLDKLLDRERQTLLKQRDQLQSELRSFEQLYNLDSAKFHRKFNAGEMGDDLDYVDWAGTWRVYQTLQTSLDMLETESSIS